MFFDGDATGVKMGANGCMGSEKYFYQLLLDL